jgi:hypothetical protein
VFETSVAMALAPPDAQKPPPRPAGGSHCLVPIALGVTWGGLVSGRGHRKDQFRVLGSHSALHINIPRKGFGKGKGATGGAGGPRTRFFSIFDRIVLIHSWGN